MFFFIIKILLIAAGIGFLLWTFVKRLLLIIREDKMQKRLERKEQIARSKEQEVRGKEQEARSTEETKPAKTGSDIRKLFKKGEVHFSRKEWDEAEKYFVQILAIDETNLDGNLQLGLTYLNQGNNSKAEFFFHKLVNLKKDPVYYSNLGLALYNQGRLLEAAEAYENALSMDDSRAARFANLAYVYKELNNDEKALENFEKASKRSPRNKDYLWALTEYYQKLSRTDDLTATAKRILDMDPYNKEAKKIISSLQK